MTARPCSLVLIAILLAAPAMAKDKKKSTLPDYVLRATTVRVVIMPDSGEPVDHPMANSTARDDVEKALMQWGRLRPVLDGQESDLVIAVRTGSARMMQPTIKGGGIDNRPGVVQPTDGGIRVGVQQGTPPPPNDPSMGPQNGPQSPQNRPQNGPRISNEVGPTEDVFEVYRGGVADPLDSSPVWRYIAKDCLRAPGVSAVEQFRKAIAEAEEPQLPKKP
jgi:hypothetical protein